MGGHNFNWTTFWDSNTDWSYLRLDLQRKSGTQVKPPCLGSMRAMPCLCFLYPGIRPTTEEKNREKNVIQGSQ